MSKKLLLLFFIIALNYLYSQSKAEEALQRFDQNFPQEKIHLIIDKKKHIAGENLWFKAFVFEGYNLTNISTNLFVELYDKNKNIVDKKMLPLVKGESNGSLTLPETLTEDVYYIRAYTTWMANFSENFQYLQPIEIFNISSPNKLVEDTNTSWSAFLYPESGTFIDGIATKFTVRLQPKGTKNSEWGGYVVDTENPDTKIISFKGFDQNVGSFILTPKLNKKYKLIVQSDNKVQQDIELPNVSPSGIHLQVTSNKNEIKYSLNSKNVSQHSKFYTLLATINSRLVYKAEFKKIPTQTYSVPTENLINGILQFSLFDDQGNLISQRLCFVQPELLNLKEPSLQLSLDKSPRKLNTFEITKDQNINSYTVLVQDSEVENLEDEKSFLSTLWLTGDMTSDIVNPAQYFTKNRNTEALDALLISEKWKRFDWKNILSNIYPVIKYKPDEYITYKAKVTINNEPAVNKTLHLIFNVPDFGSKFVEVQTDKSGFFTLSGMMFDNTIDVAYQLNKDQLDEKDQVKVYFQPTYSFIPYGKALPDNKLILAKKTPNDEPDPEVRRYIAGKKNQNIINEKITDIEEVKIKISKKDKTKKLNEELSSPLFSNINEQVFDLVNDNTDAKTSFNILAWLQSRVAGLQVNFEQGNYIPYLRDRKVDLYLNEMKVNAEQISNFPVSSIAMVKVIKGMFLGSFSNGGGAILIYTLRGGMTADTFQQKFSGLKKYVFKGYDKEAPFNSPDYNESNFSGLPDDRRAILYWNPSYTTETNEENKVRFFNNDHARSFKIIIVGFDKNGTPSYYNETL
ncbi:hypothetical protein [Chryseobacterium wangxinyae]|uniref:hypothetical protein n=1 Tax=Chryseobacterium sp. CY353 TaxID=2997334 RepID=UPI0022710D32|nr:hypothetical protein [Chryseobacterium sp. CY353]MCY0969539.1 hypothetical protein [Chryseobacterium sp. CY353]